ncbi:MAG: branched-chain amino acid ABC transporter permease [Anaerolineae bacterium]|nr:MAG: branched-chain amino acid ABC transporter permease [Anaerolineae bacterium]
MTATVYALVRRTARLVRARWRPAFWLLVLAFLPLVYFDSYFIHVMILSMIMAALASSWNLMLGYAGIFSFGHQAFFGLGAYISALLAMRVGLSPWLGMVAAGVVAAAVSPVIAVPCLRLRAAPYISIATLSFAEICRITAMNLVDITCGVLGLWGIPELFAGGDRLPSYYTILALLTMILWAIARIVKSPLGLALCSVRESQEAAEALGVDVARTKILAFSVSAFMAGVVGAFYAHYLVFLTPSSVFSVRVMVETATITLLGGLGTLTGPVLAALGTTLGLEYLRELGDYRLLLYGGGMVMLILFMPEGIVPRLRLLLKTQATQRGMGEGGPRNGALAGQNQQVETPGATEAIGAVDEQLQEL